MYSSYIDSEGVWKLDREENGEKRRSIYWEERTEMAVCPESKELFESAGVISSKISFFILTIRVKWKVLWTS